MPSAGPELEYSPRKDVSEDRRRLWLAAILLVLTVAAYEGVRQCSFLRYDDDLFVTANPHVQRGLTAASLRWAFEADLCYDSPNADYWAPVTVLSRLVDVQLFDMRPAGHHLTNLALHAANVVLLFGVLGMLTGALWRSAFVAAVLAVHPLHVESVAWVTERKDVLSGAFWMLTIGAYAIYVRSPGRGRGTALILTFALGLMAKPMLATLPFVLLLLDYWPLGRFGRPAALVREKWPLFLLSALSVGISVASNTQRLDTTPLGARVANMAVSYVAYLRQAVWPAGLAVGYPHVGDSALPVASVVACFLVLALVSVLALRARARHPYLLVGWCWFLGTLVPVIGPVQVGVHGRADRFVYLPLIGVSLAVTWLAGRWADGATPRRVITGVVAVLALTTLLSVTRRQVRYWKDDLALFQHSVGAVPDSPIARSGLASALSQRGDLDGAERELREALRLRPDLAVAARNLAFLLAQRGRGDEAVGVIEQALRSGGRHGPAAASELHFALGLLKARGGRSAEAPAHYAAAVRADPRQWAALYNWGNLLAAEGRFAEAEAKYLEALRYNRDDANLVNNLGLVCLGQGRVDAAVRWLREAVRSFPENALVRTSLGRALTAAGRREEAVAELREAVRLAPQSAEARFRLAEAQKAGSAADP